MAKEVYICVSLERYRCWKVLVQRLLSHCMTQEPYAPEYYFVVELRR